jgi:hypothetical protein
MTRLSGACYRIETSSCDERKKRSRTFRSLRNGATVLWRDNRTTRADIVCRAVEGMDGSTTSFAVAVADAHWMGDQANRIRCPDSTMIWG